MLARLLEYCNIYDYFNTEYKNSEKKLNLYELSEDFPKDQVDTVFMQYDNMNTWIQEFIKCENMENWMRRKHRQ